MLESIVIPSPRQLNIACLHRLLRNQYAHQASLCDSALLLFALDQVVRSPYHYLANKPGMVIYQSEAATGSRARWLLNERRRARIRLRTGAAKAKGDDIDYMVIQPNTLQPSNAQAQSGRSSSATTEREESGRGNLRWYKGCATSTYCRGHRL